MRFADILKKDVLKIDGDISLISAVQKLVSASCDSAPVFLKHRFIGLFVPEECWQHLTCSNCQQQKVKEFVSENCRTVTESSDIISIISSSDRHLIGIDETGEYVGHMTRKNLVKEKLIQEKQYKPFFTSILIESLSVGLIAIDPHSIITLVNRVAEDILSIKKADLLGKHIRSVLPQSRLPEALFSDEPRITTLSLKESAVIAGHSPIQKDGKVYGAVSVFHNISKFEEIAAELESMKALVGELNAIFDNSYDGIYITDGDGNTLRVNQSYERITGLKRASLLHKNMREIVSKGMISESLTFKIKESKKPMTITQKIHGGKEILVSGVPVFNEQGELYRVITNVRDMSELNNIKNQLEKSRELTSRYEHELNALRAAQIEDSEFISNSKNMNAAVELAFRVAKVDSTVLIQGESGVGKEIIANLVHKNSPRLQTGSFIKINCSAIPADLLESELFGYEEGAFTGAKKHGKPGMFELAHNGTLFLDEIGTIPETLQIKLLRVIQFKEIQRLGGVRSQKVNIRLLTATSRNLEELMKKGKFREDLYYRLKVVPIRVPPLRERKDDIFPLTTFYLDKFNRKYRHSKRFSSEAIEALTMYQWPGNVRELVNLVERLVVTTTRDIIEWKDLPLSVTDQGKFPKLIREANGESLKEIVELVEKEAMVQAFKNFRTTRNVAQALKISQSAVMRKVKKYNLKFNKGWNA